jgi:hypothetical protein
MHTRGFVCPVDEPATLSSPVIMNVSAKQRARRVVEELPEDASLEDVIEKLIVVHKIEKGLQQARAGEGLMDQEDVEAHFMRRREGREP